MWHPAPWLEQGPGVLGSTSNCVLHHMDFLEAHGSPRYGLGKLGGDRGVTALDVPKSWRERRGGRAISKGDSETRLCPGIKWPSLKLQCRLLLGKLRASDDMQCIHIVASVLPVLHALRATMYATTTPFLTACRTVYGVPPLRFAPPRKGKADDVKLGR